MNATPPSSLQTTVYASLGEVPRAVWDELALAHSCTFSTAFWQLIETSKLNDFAYRYVLLSDEQGHVVAAACFYTVTTDIAIFAPKGLRAGLAMVRKVFPNFLKLRMLECGTPITLNSPPFAASPDISPQVVAEALSSLLLKQAKDAKQLLVVIRDFEPGADGLRGQMERLGYHWVASLPNTYMDIPWKTPEEYVASMKSYYRSKLIKHLRRNEKLGIRHELVDDFHDLADTLCAQWLVVHQQADEFQREVLTPDFYREFSQAMGPRSKAILLYRGDVLVGHALLLMDGEMLRWLYFGRTEAVNDSLYIYVAHKVIESAILLGARRLELGLTTYAIKQDLGARATPIHLALCSPSRWINPLVGLVYPLINHTPGIENKQVFKEAEARDAKKVGRSRPAAT